MYYVLLIVGAALVNNFVLARFLGICPFMGVSKSIDTAVGMSMAVIFVMALASFVTWLINFYLLVPFELEYLQTIAFILVIASLVQLVEMIIQRVSPPLYQALGIYLPLITTNCAVLGGSHPQHPARLQPSRRVHLCRRSRPRVWAGAGDLLRLEGELRAQQHSRGIPGNSDRSHHRRHTLPGIHGILRIGEIR